MNQIKTTNTFFILGYLKHAESAFSSLAVISLLYHYFCETLYLFPQDSMPRSV